MAIWAFALAALLTNATSAYAQSSTDLADSLIQHATRLGAIPWSARHRVEWPDFRGRPHNGGSTAAETATGIGYMIQCRDEHLAFAVLATFSPFESWVRTDVPGSSTASAATLRHERAHFDITELFARRLRQALSAGQDICPHGTKDARRTFEQLRSASDQMQIRYDKETSHGQAAGPQAQWEKRISAGLDSLAKFRIDGGKD